MLSRTTPLLEWVRDHTDHLKACARCPQMLKPVVCGKPVISSVLLVGQAPGDKEPILGRPFAWTAGKKLFRWIQEYTGITEADFRDRVYMAAVCRCFPGKKPTGGDRVPDPVEISNCLSWLEAELNLLHPTLVLAVGKLAITQFAPCARLEFVVGKQFPVTWRTHSFDLIPLPHPSGASPWSYQEPGRSLLPQAFRLIVQHAAWQETFFSTSSP